MPTSTLAHLTEQALTERIDRVDGRVDEVHELVLRVVDALDRLSDAVLELARRDSESAA